MFLSVFSSLSELGGVVVVDLGHDGAILDELVGDEEVVQLVGAEGEGVLIRVEGRVDAGRACHPLR